MPPTTGPSPSKKRPRQSQSQFTAAASRISLSPPTTMNSTDAHEMMIHASSSTNKEESSAARTTSPPGKSLSEAYYYHQKDDHGDHDSTDDDDSSVQVLFVRTPQPQATAVSEGTTSKRSLDSDDHSESSESENDDDDHLVLMDLKEQEQQQSPLLQVDDSQPKKSRGPQEEEEEEEEDVEDLRPTAETEEKNQPMIIAAANAQEYSWFRTSAYVQHLAELCHALLWDHRWRTNQEQQSKLFGWERGDDMSVVMALAQWYVQLDLLETQTDSSPKPTNDTPESSSSNTSTENEKKDDETKTPSVYPYTTFASTTDDDYERAVHLYCRMYARKGPWFRIDDLWTRYYYSKNQAKHNVEKNPEQDDDDTTATKVPAAAAAPSSPSKFFQRKVSSISNASSSSNSAKTPVQVGDILNLPHLEDCLQSLSLLVTDLQRLQSMGWIRSFDSEAECGRSTSSLLKHDEQRQVLSKLGGGGTKKSSFHRSTSSGSHSSSSSRRSGRNDDTTSNLIWKQMTQQRTISFGTNTQEKNLLPVRKHVNSILIEALVKIIFDKASNVEYIPARRMREVTKLVRERVQDILGPYNNSILCCCRLREAPLRTLQRLHRLYLCATSGPGDMRGNGRNGWRSLPNPQQLIKSNVKYPNHKIVGAVNSIPPPGTESWHLVSSPGSDYRFRLISCSFTRSYRPLLVGKVDKPHMIQVFATQLEFHQWEVCVELRAVADYLIELNDLVQYQERKRKRNQGDDPIAESSPFQQEEPRNELDYLSLLTSQGRNELLSKLCVPRTTSYKEQEEFQRIETTCQEILQALEDMVSASSETNEEVVSRPVELHQKCERILVVLAVLSIEVLALSHQTLFDSTVDTMEQRPWLRHLRWQSCLAYLLWDIIPILERRGLYAVAIQALELLALGKYRSRTEVLANPLPKTLVSSSSFCCDWLSRRARGKAFERLMIDYVHLLRARSKKNDKEEAQVELTKSEPAAGTDPAKKKRKRKSKADSSNNKNVEKKKKPEPPPIASQVLPLCQELINRHASTGRISFCAIRTLARKLQQPLRITLANNLPLEVQYLGHRLDNFSTNEAKLMEETKKYVDFVPTTDFAVANAITNDTTGPGGRCSYIGLAEDNEISSKNVEELAMQYYNLGYLPVEVPEGDVRGGWSGWHDEGGRVRALFRILSSSQVLGMDWSDSISNNENDLEELLTIHLTPYQGAPFDLHVGMESVKDGPSTSHRRGFLERRKEAIKPFLDELSTLSPQGCADRIYDNVAKRFTFMQKSGREDPSLERDVLQLRTLCFLAASLGGRVLASICKCLFFDYRHYSGGLPDCTLVRALSESDDGTKQELVDLGEWVGESFSAEFLAAQEAERSYGLLEDRDSEFLGCSKVGDSGGAGQRNRSFGRSMGPTLSTRGSDAPSKVPLKLPDRLVLVHNDKPVHVEAMMVEVKSLNDRLDPRQEDWLNILDIHGNARVCKFGKEEKKTTDSSKKTKKK